MFQLSYIHAFQLKQVPISNSDQARHACHGFQHLTETHAKLEYFHAKWFGASANNAFELRHIAGQIYTIISNRKPASSSCHACKEMTKSETLKTFTQAKNEDKAFCQRRKMQQLKGFRQFQPAAISLSYRF